MSINDIPEDLYFYFPLELGGTCKKFNSKINIYNRNVRITGDVTADYIDYKKLTRIDLTGLEKYKVYTVISRIKPVELKLDNFNGLLDLNLSKLKILTVTGKEMYSFDSSVKKVFKRISGKKIVFNILELHSIFAYRIPILQGVNINIKSVSLTSTYYSYQTPFLKKLIPHFNVESISCNSSVINNIIEILSENKNLHVHINTGRKLKNLLDHILNKTENNISIMFPCETKIKGVATIYPGDPKIEEIRSIYRDNPRIKYVMTKGVGKNKFGIESDSESDIEIDSETESEETN